MIFSNFLKLVGSEAKLDAFFEYNFVEYILIYWMDNSEILKQIQSIQKEGFCDKQSRFLKSWRK